MASGKGAAALLGTLSGSLLVTLLVLQGQSQRAVRETQAKTALLQALGLPSLAISSDCTSTRNLTEGLCGCLGDVPGSYCYHSSCDLVTSPDVLRLSAYTVAIERDETLREGQLGNQAIGQSGN